MRSLTEKYHGVEAGRYTKAQFLRDVRVEFPGVLHPANTYVDAIRILKNKGMIYETAAPADAPAVSKSPRTLPYPINQNFPIEAVERGLDYELAKKGFNIVDPDFTEKDRDKCLQKVYVNLEKDLNFYLNILAGESGASKNDEPIEWSSKTLVDTKNGMKKAQMREDTLTDKERGQIKEVFKKLILTVLNESSK